MKTFQEWLETRKLNERKYLPKSCEACGREFKPKIVVRTHSFSSNPDWIRHGTDIDWTCGHCGFDNTPNLVRKDDDLENLEKLFVKFVPAKRRGREGRNFQNYPMSALR